VLALAAVRNNDRVGLVLFTDRVEHVVRPRKGRRHALRLLRDLLAAEPVGTGTRVGAAAEYVGKLLGHKAIVFVVSDFADPDLEHPLKRLALRHDVVAVTVEDPGERALPDVGLARFVDPETGEVVDVDTGDVRVRRAYDEAVATEREARERLFRRLAIDEVPVRTDGGYVEPLLKFFRSRETRAGEAMTTAPPASARASRRRAETAAAVRLPPCDGRRYAAPPRVSPRRSRSRPRPQEASRPARSACRPG
jgi:uncharacterized protein (DUF58 family)